MSDTLDLELRLGFGPRDVAPATPAPAEVSDHGETVQLVEAAGEKEEEEEEAEMGSKRAKAEPPTMEPAWVRAELVACHGFPGHLPLHFVQEKVLTGSDLQSDQSRLLFCSAGSARLRSFLSAAELTRCGLDDDGARRRLRQERRAAAPAPGQGQDGAEKKKKREKTRFPGVPVLVYERGPEAELAAPAALRLNSFRSSMGIVINGLGYKRFVAGSGFRKGDRVEVWAFRRPHDQHLCFVIAKRDDVDLYHY
ncbi:unnamed protein product [Urochloa decumbens]|uniref:Uncharacterized protein n=1 Tax=Urochloa decumbens TaxID=240449 RepID=A0ABC8XM52_9POAL